MSDDRAERVRKRRNRARSKAAETDESSEPSKPPEPDKTEQADEQDETGESDEPSVKDEREGTYMYLPEWQKSEINLAFKRANLKFEEATGEELEKNRHFYPLLIQEGLDGLESLDGRDIKERLDSLEV